LKDRERSANSVVNFNRGETVMIGAERKINKRGWKKGMLKNIVQP
jgi:hypothetical protein